MTKGPGVTDTTRPSKIEISQAAEPISRRKVVVRNRPRRTSASSLLTRAISASIITLYPSCDWAEPPFRRGLCRPEGIMGGTGARSIVCSVGACNTVAKPLRDFANRAFAVEAGLADREPPLQPGAYQCQIGDTGRQQGNRQRHMYALARGLLDRSHGGPKHRAILGGESRRIFFPRFRTRLRLKERRPALGPRPSTRWLPRCCCNLTSSVALGFFAESNHALRTFQQ